MSILESSPSKPIEGNAVRMVLDAIGIEASLERRDFVEARIGYYRALENVQDKATRKNKSQLPNGETLKARKKYLEARNTLLASAVEKVQTDRSSEEVKRKKLNDLYDAFIRTEEHKLESKFGVHEDFAPTLSEDTEHAVAFTKAFFNQITQERDREASLHVMPSAPATEQIEKTTQARAEKLPPLKKELFKQFTRVFEHAPWRFAIISGALFAAFPEVVHDQYAPIPSDKDANVAPRANTAPVMITAKGANQAFLEILHSGNAPEWFKEWAKEGSPRRMSNIVLAEKASERLGFWKPGVKSETISIGNTLQFTDEGLVQNGPEGKVVLLPAPKK